jgi:hypothetical protein
MSQVAESLPSKLEALNSKPSTYQKKKKKKKFLLPYLLRKLKHKRGVFASARGLDSRWRKSSEVEDEGFAFIQLCLTAWLASSWS